MKKNETFHFWGKFIFYNCFAYVALFLAVRSGNWKLRMAAIKSMAALFTAFDRQKYQKLIPQHFVDMLTIPSDILSNLESGGFTVSLKGPPCHKVGMDEVHEMCIRIARNILQGHQQTIINRTALFIPVRAEAMKNFEREIFIQDEKSKETSINFFFSKMPKD